VPVDKGEGRLEGKKEKQRENRPEGRFRGVEVSRLLELPVEGTPEKERKTRHTVDEVRME
jgi:hypothetical protein